MKRTRQPFARFAIVVGVVSALGVPIAMAAGFAPGYTGPAVLLGVALGFFIVSAQEGLRSSKHTSGEQSDPKPDPPSMES
jgi:hypothetical protein